MKKSGVSLEAIHIYSDRNREQDFSTHQCKGITMFGVLLTGTAAKVYLKPDKKWNSLAGARKETLAERVFLFKASRTL